MSEEYELGEIFGATARTDVTGYWELAPSSDTNKRMYSEDEMRDLYNLLDDQFGDEDGGDEDNSVTGKELFDHQIDHQVDMLYNSLYDASEKKGRMFSNFEFNSMNTRPINELFTDYGRVMANNDRDHDRVITMSDVNEEIQSLCERVTELEKQP